MKQCPLWEAYSHSASEQLSCLSWNSKIYQCVHSIPPPDPWARWIHSTSSHHVSLQFVILLLSFQLFRGLSSGLFISKFPTKILYAFLMWHAYYLPFYLIFYNFIITIIFDEENLQIMALPFMKFTLTLFLSLLLQNFPSTPCFHHLSIL